MIEVKTKGDKLSVRVSGDSVDVTAEACLLIDAAIRILRVADNDEKFCRGMFETALDHYFG